jgi:hypothetical protein
VARFFGFSWQSLKNINLNRYVNSRRLVVGRNRTNKNKNGAHCKLNSYMMSHRNFVALLK